MNNVEKNNCQVRRKKKNLSLADLPKGSFSNKKEMIKEP